MTLFVGFFLAVMYQNDTIRVNTRLVEVIDVKTILDFLRPQVILTGPFAFPT